MLCEKNITLNNLPVNSFAKIIKLDIKGSIRRRFLDLGMIEGSLIGTKLVAPLGDPKAYSIKGTVIALRDEDAKKVTVRKLTSEKLLHKQGEYCIEK